jgi:hypothetical protein
MRVIGVTPAGRRRYLAALVPHLLRQRHVIDEHHWWLNTNDPADARFVEEVSARNPEFFKICRKEVRSDLNMGENIWRFFQHYAEPDTLYVRFDDDIVYMEPDAVENLVQYRLSHREPVLVMGNIVNNALCSHAYQRHGIVPQSWGEVEQFCLDGNGWFCADFACKLHQLFLADLDQGRTQRWKQIDLPLEFARRFSINVISWLGDDFASIPEVAGGIVDEEPFLTITLPRRLGRPAAACPEALFAHYAYYPQRPRLEWTWPTLVDHYQAIAQQRRSAPSLSERAMMLARRQAWKYGKPIRKLRTHVRKRWARSRAA